MTTGAVDVEPADLCAAYLPDDDINAIDWLTSGLAGEVQIEDQWLGTAGEVLTLFAPSDREPADVLAADLAALLVSGGFVPGDPAHEGNRIRGRTTTAVPAGPGRLDIVAFVDSAGTRRLVLQRPQTDGLAAATLARHELTVEDVLAIVERS